MTPTTFPGFLNKKEIEATYGRSYRSLTRDITRAVKSGDAKVLQHLKLVTEDEKVREGTEVDLDLIQELSNNGLRPMWLAEESWVAEWCLLKSSSQDKEQNPIQQEPTREPRNTNKTFEGTTTLETVLQQRLHDLKSQNELLVDQLKIKDDQIRAANQQAEQNQQLMRDLHVLLKNVQDGLLGEGRPLIAVATTPQKSPRPAVRVEESIDTKTETPIKAPDPKPIPVVVKAKTAKKRGTSQKGSDRQRTSKSSTVPAGQRRKKLTEVTPVHQPANIFQQWLPTFFGAKPRKK